MYVYISLFEFLWVQCEEINFIFAYIFLKYYQFELRVPFRLTIEGFDTWHLLWIYSHCPMAFKSKSKYEKSLSVPMSVYHVPSRHKKMSQKQKNITKQSCQMNFKDKRNTYIQSQADQHPALCFLSHFPAMCTHF